MNLLANMFHAYRSVRKLRRGFVFMGCTGNMKPLKTIVGILVAAIALIPAVAPAATTAGPQPQFISRLQQIVAVRRQLIATLPAEVARLEAEVSSLSANPTYSQLWPLPQTPAATSTPPPAPIPSAGASCVSKDGIIIQSGQSVMGDQGLGGHAEAWWLKCKDGQWLFMGLTPVLFPPYLGPSYKIFVK
jgi:hypothetical protein